MLEDFLFFSLYSFSCIASSSTTLKDILILVLSIRTSSSVPQHPYHLRPIPPVTLKGSHKGNGKATARAKMLTSVINRRLLLDRDRMKGFISEHIRELIRIYNVCGVKDERAWDLFYDRILLDPVTTRHLLQFPLMWPHCRSRSSHFREWWAAFRSYMGQMFDTTHDQMNNWRWDNPRDFGDHVDRSNPQTTSSGKIKRTGERFPCYSSDDHRAKIVPPGCRQYKPGDFLAVRPRNSEDIMDEDDEDANWADAGAPCGGRRCHGNVNDNDNGEGEEDMQGGEKRNEKGKGTKDGKGKRKRKGKGNGKRKSIGKQTPGGDDISRAVTLQLQKERYEADSDTEGQLEGVYSEPEASPGVSVSSDDDTDSTAKSDCEYVSEHDFDVDMRMENDVDAPDGVNLDGHVDMERDGDDDEEEDDEEDDEQKEDEEEVEEQDEDEEEDKDGDDGKEPWTMGPEEMVNTSADDVDTMVDDEPTVLPVQRQEVCEHTPRPEPPGPATQPHTPVRPPRPRIPETHTLSGLQFLGLETQQQPRPAALTLREAEAAGNTLDVDLALQLLVKSAAGDSLPDVPLPDVSLPDVTLPDVPLPEACPDGSVGEE